MDNNFASSIDSKHRHPRSLALRSLVLLLGFGCAASLLLGSCAHPRILPLSGWLPKSSLSVSISRTTSHWKAPDDTHVWNLTLVNPWNPLPEDHSISLKQVESGQAVDQRCAEALQAMMNDCRAAGLSPLICSSYRTQETQQGLYDAQVNAFLAQGYSRKEAESMAATIVALPGTSEHQLGLAVDIVDQNYQILESSQEDTPVQRWLMEHCWEYGFILRYPEEKSDLTGIIYEPWHYRYVGVEAAKVITQAGICLEEYVGATAKAVPDSFS